MNRRSIVTATAVTVILGLAGCSASAGSGGTTVAPSLSAVVSPDPTPSSAPSPTAVPAATGACSLIDQSAATQVLGSDPGPGKGSGGLGENDGITKVDGCTYVAGGSHLGYDVLVFKGLPVDRMLARSQSKVKGLPGVKEFSTGLDKSLGYTFKVGSGVDSEIAFIVGDNWVTVAVSRKDGDATKTEAAVLAAAQAISSSL